MSTSTTYTIAFKNKSGVTTKFEECELQFTVTDRPPDVTCEFTTASDSYTAGSPVTLPLAVTGCDAGDCKYKLDDGSYENSIGSFSAPSEAGSYAHSVTVQRGSETEVSCVGTYTVNVPLGGSCGATTVSGTLHPGDQVQPPTPTISGCNSKCNYDVTKSDNNSAYGDGTQTGYNGTSAPATFTAGNDVATDGTATQYNLVISHQNSGVTPVTCPFSVTYASASSGIVCDAVTSGAYPGASLTFPITIDPHILPTDNVSVAVYLDNESNPFFSNSCNYYSCGHTISGTLPEDLNAHTYTLKIAGVTRCSEIPITMSNPVGCLVDKSIIDIDQSFDFTTTYAGDGCWNFSITAEGGSGHGLPSSISDCQSTYTITPTAVGTYTYTYSVTNGNAGKGTCSKSVEVKQVVPTFDCATGLKATIDQSDNVTIKLADVKHCEEGGEYCKYSITGTDIIEQTGSSISDGLVKSLTAFTDNGSSGTSKQYTVKLQNSAGWSGTKTCSVEFTSASVPVCHPPTGCSEPVVTSGTLAFDGRCYFATYISNINAAWDAYFKVNDYGWMSNYTAGSTFTNKIDGGFYIQTPVGNYYGGPSDVTLGKPTCE